MAIIWTDPFCGRCPTAGDTRRGHAHTGSRRGSKISASVLDRWGNNHSKFQVRSSEARVDKG